MSSLRTIRRGYAYGPNWDFSLDLIAYRLFRDWWWVPRLGLIQGRHALRAAMDAAGERKRSSLETEHG